MLVLSRKQSQQIVIGRDIRITVVKVERNQVRLGIDAPQGVVVLREELVGKQSESEGRAQAQADRPRMPERVTGTVRSAAVLSSDGWGLTAADLLAAFHLTAARECAAGPFTHGEALETETDLRAQIVDLGLGILEDQSHLVGAVLVAVEVDLHFLGPPDPASRLCRCSPGSRVSWSRA